MADASLTVAAGEFVSVVGPTGCGKSTLLNIAAGLLAPSQGKVSVFGQPLVAANGVNRYVRGANDDPTARVAIYVPTGYQINTAAAPGKIGDVAATAAAADLGGAILPLTGELDVVGPNPTQGQCLGSSTAAAYWDLHLTAAGQMLDRSQAVNFG